MLDCQPMIDGAAADIQVGEIQGIVRTPSVQALFVKMVSPLRYWCKSEPREAQSKWPRPTSWFEFQLAFCKDLVNPKLNLGFDWNNPFNMIGLNCVLRRRWCSYIYRCRRWCCMWILPLLLLMLVNVIVTAAANSSSANPEQSGWRLLTWWDLLASKHSAVTCGGQLAWEPFETNNDARAGDHKGLLHFALHSGPWICM